MRLNDDAETPPRFFHSHAERRRPLCLV